MRKTLELIYAFSPSKRLNIFKDSLLCNRVPTIDFINLLNQDRLLLARNNVQQRTIRILNESVYVQTDKGAFYNKDSYTKSELLKRAGELDISQVVKLIPTMDISRLASLIHAVTGDIPVIHSTLNIHVSPTRFTHAIDTQSPTSTTTTTTTTSTTTTRSDTATIPVAAASSQKNKTDISQR